MIVDVPSISENRNHNVLRKIQSVIYFGKYNPQCISEASFRNISIYSSTAIALSESQNNVCSQIPANTRIVRLFITKHTIFIMQIFIT
jgi:hypothetical protein